MQSSLAQVIIQGAAEIIIALPTASVHTNGRPFWHSLSGNAAGWQNSTAVEALQPPLRFKRMFGPLRVQATETCHSYAATAESTQEGKIKWKFGSKAAAELSPRQCLVDLQG